MKVGILGTPRPMPSRLVPALAGASAVAFALPVFVLAGWRLSGWALGAVLWLGAQALVVLVSRFRPSPDSVAGSGVLAFGMMLRAVAVMVVVVAVAASDAALGLAAAGVYALAYTLELGLSVAAYYGGPSR